MGFGRTSLKPKDVERDVQENSGRMGKLCVCVCVGVRCVFLRAGTRRPFHAPPQLKPMDEVKSGNERCECLRMTGHNGTVCGNRLLWITNVAILLYQVALHLWDDQIEKGETVL